MDTLTLPPFPYQGFRKGDKAYILDIVRKKHVRLTPEEWVRQHLLHYLIQHLSYPKALLKLELPIRYDRCQRRIDIAVFQPDSPRPVMLVECKAATQLITQDALEQVARYNMALQAPYLLVSNGRVHYCFLLHPTRRTSKLLAHIPPYPQLRRMASDAPSQG